MAIAERNMAARFGKSLVDHRTWVIASDGDLMEGISHEAAALAGHLGLNKLTVMYDDNHISIDGDTALVYSDDVLKRFAAYGWATKCVDGHDPDADPRRLVLRHAVQETDADRLPHDHRPRRANQGRHPWRARLAARRDGGRGARQLLGWTDPPFQTPPDLLDRWHAVGSRGASARRSWLKRLARHNQRAEFERVDGRPAAGQLA